MPVFSVEEQASLGGEPQCVRDVQHTWSFSHHRELRALAVGQCAFPARVFKGMKMAGHMGHQQVTTQNLEVVQSDSERNILLIKGSVPGPAGGVVIVRNAVKLAGKGS